MYDVITYFYYLYLSRFFLLCQTLLSLLLLPYYSLIFYNIKTNFKYINILIASLLFVPSFNGKEDHSEEINFAQIFKMHVC